jgi:hypothetical protein
LLKVASDHFDVFLTVDRNLPFQQSLKKFDIAVVGLIAGSILVRDLRPLMPRVRLVLPLARPGQVVLIGGHPHHFRLKESPYSAAVSRSVRMASCSSGVR